MVKYQLFTVKRAANAEEEREDRGTAKVKRLGIHGESARSLKRQKAKRSSSSGASRRPACGSLPQEGEAQGDPGQAGGRDTAAGGEGSRRSEHQALEARSAEADLGQANDLLSAKAKGQAKLEDTEKALVKAGAVMNRKSTPSRPRSTAPEAPPGARRSSWRPRQGLHRQGEARRPPRLAQAPREEPQGTQGCPGAADRDLVAARAALAKQVKLTNGWDKKATTTKAEDKEYGRHIAKQTKDMAAAKAARAKEKAKASPDCPPEEADCGEHRQGEQAEVESHRDQRQGERHQRHRQDSGRKIASRQKVASKTAKKITDTKNKITVEKSF